MFWVNGYVDPYYLKFATPKQSSMILGTSRSSLALCPSVFKKNGFENLFNYSFTISNSPWGEDYYNSIVQKLDTTKTDGLFILSVDPFSLSANPKEGIPHTILYDVKDVCKSPNWDYIWRYRVQPWKYLLQILKLERSSFCLHKDGWYENKRIWSADVEFVETKMKIEEYKLEFSEHKISDVRILYFEKTIQLLKQYGTIVMLRVPTSEPMVTLECNMFPDYDSVIENVAKRYGLRYLDFSKASSYRTFDGNHLIPEDAMLFSQQVCDSIL